MLKMRFDDGKQFTKFLSAIDTIVEEATFQVTPEGIKVRSMDPSRVALVEFWLPKSWFTEYECGNQKLCLDTKSFLSVMRRCGDDKAEFGLTSDGKLGIKFTGGNQTRDFSVPLLEVIDDELPPLRLLFSARVKIYCWRLRDALEDAKLVTDHVKLITDEKGLKMIGKGNLMNADIDLKKEALPTLEVQEPTKATYNLTFLCEIVKAAADLADTVIIEYKSDMPIKLSFEMKTGSLVYFLAPRIEVA